MDNWPGQEDRIKTTEEYFNLRPAGTKENAKKDDEKTTTRIASQKEEASTERKGLNNDQKENRGRSKTGFDCLQYKRAKA